MIAEALAARAAAAGLEARTVRDDDADQLAALIGGVFAEYAGCVFDPDGIDADLGAWATHLAELGGAGWVLEDTDGRVVASVGVAPTRELPPGTDAVVPTGQPVVVELKRLYVQAEARRGGLGQALVDQVETWAHAHGADLVVLWSDTRFADAHRLYTRLGYQQLDAQRHLHDPSDTTESAFVRALSD